MRQVEMAGPLTRVVIGDLPHTGLIDDDVVLLASRTVVFASAAVVTTYGEGSVRISVCGSWSVSYTI